MVFSSDFLQKRLENRQNQRIKNKKVVFLTARQIYAKNFSEIHLSISNNNLVEIMHFT